MSFNINELSDFLTSEIEKHVRLGMQAVLKKVDEKLSELPEPEKIPDIQAMIDEAISLIPYPEPVKGDKGEDGKDGISPTAEEVAKSLEHKFSEWALGFERKADDKLEKAIDKLRQPENGKDGRDAIELKDFDIELSEDGRTINMSLKTEDAIVERSLKIPTVIDRGVYKESNQYEKGDAVTYAGSLFIAQTDNPDGKPETSSGWRLAVKRGRDGREAVKVDRKIETVKV